MTILSGTLRRQTMRIHACLKSICVFFSNKLFAVVIPKEIKINNRNDCLTATLPEKEL